MWVRRHLVLSYHRHARAEVTGALFSLNSPFPKPRWIRFSSVLEDEQQTVFKGEAILLEDAGISVISDIGTLVFSVVY